MYYSNLLSSYQWRQKVFSFIQHWHSRCAQRVKLGSHMCDTTRHDIMRHDSTEDQDMTIFSLVPHIPWHDHATWFWFITNFMTVSWCTVDYQTFLKRIMLLQMKIRVSKEKTSRHNHLHDFLNFLSKNLIQKFWLHFTGDWVLG